MDKEDVADVYNGISLHHKKNNVIMPFAATWIIIQSEVSQTEKDKYQIMSLVYGI